MISTWLFIILCVFIQEPASTDAAIFQVRSLHLDLLLVNLIWLAASALDIWIGYKIGKWIQKRYRGKKFILLSEQWAKKLENFIGKKGEKFALILLGVVNVPYLNSFIASWLDIPFKSLFTYILIGDAIYWIIEWGINIGARSLFTDPHSALYAVIGAGLVFSIFSKMIMDRVLKQK